MSWTPIAWQNGDVTIARYQAFENSRVLFVVSRGIDVLHPDGSWQEYIGDSPGWLTSQDAMEAADRAIAELHA